MSEEGHDSTGTSAGPETSSAPTPDLGTATAPGAATPDPTKARRRKGKPSKRRRARRIAPAEPGARASVAAGALSEREEADPAPVPDATEPGTEPNPDQYPGPVEPAPEAPPLDPEAVIREAAPVFRVGLRVLALAIRGRFPVGARSIWDTAEIRASALAGTVGLRLAPLGGKLTIAAVLAEVAEPFLADRWNAPAAPKVAGE